MTTKKTNNVKKAAPRTKAALKEEMKEITFEKKFNILMDQLADAKYSDQFFPDDVTVEIPGKVFQAILFERKQIHNFMEQISSICGNIPKQINGVFADTYDLTYDLTTKYKESVDKGLTKTAETKAADFNESQTANKKLQERFMRRQGQLIELGYEYQTEEQKYVLGERQLNPQEVFDAVEVDFLKLIA